MLNNLHIYGVYKPINKNNNNKYNKFRFNISAINRHLSELMTFPKITEGFTYDGTTKFIGGDKSPYITFDKR